jgi:predicted amidophosphoribosyltransferase
VPPVMAQGGCRYCGGDLPAGRAITFCPHCGQNMTVMQCPACSAELEVDWHFCPTCGRKIETAEGAAG